MALDGPLIVIFAYFLYGIEINVELLLAAFLVVFSVYSLNRATDKVEDSVNRPETALKNPFFYVVPSLIALTISIGISASVSLFALLTLLVPVVVGLFYSVRLSRSMPRLKEIVGAKSLLVAFSWSFVGSTLPVSLHPVAFENVALVFAFIFVRIFVGTVLFDVLDMKGDRLSGVETIPLKLGKTRTTMLLVLLNSCLIPWLGYSLLRGLFVTYLPALLFGLLYGYVLIWSFSFNRRMRLSAELLVDGEWIPILALARIFMK
ncbi:MAG: UbiA family prenyltransferase [Candidatus Bathyarchaeia archaeon]